MRHRDVPTHAARRSQQLNLSYSQLTFFANFYKILSFQVLCYQPLHTHVHQDPKNNWRVPFKIHFFARFSLISLSIHPRSRRGAERLRQGEGRWSRPQKTALERSDFTEKFQFRASHTKAETKKTPDQIKKRMIIRILKYVFMYGCVPITKNIYIKVKLHMKCLFCAD